MFYACLSVLVLLGIMIFCVSIAIYDLEKYNFGLYIFLLCIVGSMLACALCIANPTACSNPVWYTNFCIMMQEMYPTIGEEQSSPKMSGLRNRMMAMQTSQQQQNMKEESSSKAPLRAYRQESRATVAMLAPAVHIMHQVWKGMAWVADGIEEEEERTQSAIEQNASTSETASDQMTLKRLSTIPESSFSVVIDEARVLETEDEISSDYTSSHDVVV